MLNAPNVIANLRSAFGDETLAKQTVPERAYTWVWASLRGAVMRVMEDKRVKERLDVTDVIAALDEFEARVMPEDGAESVDHSALINPMLLPVVDRAAEQFTDFLHRVAPNNGLSKDEAANLLKTAFWDEAGHIYTHEPEFYDPITTALTSPAAEGKRRELAWARHNKWIRGLWEREPIFGQEPESGLSLSKMYQRLRCFWHVEAEVEGGGRDQEPEKKLTAHVDDLHETMTGWLNGAGGAGPVASCYRRAGMREVFFRAGLCGGGDRGGDAPGGVHSATAYGAGR